MAVCVSACMHACMYACSTHCTVYICSVSLSCTQQSVHFTHAFIYVHSYVVYVISSCICTRRHTRYHDYNVCAMGIYTRSHTHTTCLEQTTLLSVMASCAIIHTTATHILTQHNHVTCTRTSIFGPQPMHNTLNKCRSTWNTH